MGLSSCHGIAAIATQTHCSLPSAMVSICCRVSSISATPHLQKYKRKTKSQSPISVAIASCRGTDTKTQHIIVMKGKHFVASCVGSRIELQTHQKFQWATLTRQGTKTQRSPRSVIIMVICYILHELYMEMHSITRSLASHLL